MIDIENDVFQMVADALSESAFENVALSSEFNAAPAEFPAVTVVEADNSVLRRMRTDNIENAVLVMYEVNIYTNTIGQRKTEAKAIAELIDNTFLSHGFTRMMKDQIPNLNDSRIYRIVARYSAVVGPHGDDSYLIYQNGA